MAGIAAIIVKIMPSSPDTDMAEIQKEAEKKLKHEGALNISFEIKPIAFGLRALMIKFAWQEEKDTDIIETILSSIPHVSSAQIDDYRRAFG